ncbi:cell wall-binding repeat-containing protein [Metallumcola ferriviriculae]|uniref:Cell wall-binding repeat-containing protein n=1 Tax=Metallumcola ferriviriculae TaxID=3039180 RepID=A0AAU0UQ68_9FIRM|nr:cell wall-binding repeat-containing protein [Desulfitibacteraceae bacterium MK1]
MKYIRRKHHVRWWFVIVLAELMLGSALLALLPGPFYSATSENLPLLKPLVTANTTRLYGKNHIETAAAISEAIYPATFTDNKPGAVILTPDNDWRTALTAVGLIHHPIDAPVLFIRRNEIPKVTMQELKRLDPEGVFLDGNVKVYVVGDVADSVLTDLSNEGYKYRHFNKRQYSQLAYSIDEYKATMEANHQDEVLLLPADAPEYALLAAPWVAHMGHTILFVERDKVPEETIKALKKRPVDAYIYLFGPEKVISTQVAKSLSQYGHVQRIPGDNPQAFSVGFAGYKDIGRNQGYWLWQSSRSFGWGVSEAGHNITFVNPDQPFDAVAAALLSHKGKHGPMLWVGRADVAPEVVKYLQLIKPFYLSNQEQLFNFGWLIGDTDAVSQSVQKRLDSLLQVKMADTTR